MLRNSVSVDMKVYMLQLNQKPLLGVSNGIFQNFRADISQIIFGVSAEKKTEEEKGVQWTLWFQVFTILELLFIKVGLSTCVIYLMEISLKVMKMLFISS